MRRNLHRSAFLLMACSLLIVGKGFAQPVVDSVRALEKANDKNYRFLNNLDPFGESYTFTNVIKWHLVDGELIKEFKDLLQKEPFNIDPKTFRVDDIYLFAAPIPGTEKVEPFHILVEGATIEKRKGRSSGLGGLGGDDDAGGTKVKRAFQGKNVIRLMHRTPSLLDDVNSIQGENVEIPGEIVPHGSQLVKDTKMRYIFSKMFTQFYSKQMVLDEQRAFYGLPTGDAAFADLSAASAGDSIQQPIDPEKTTALPDDQLADARATRYDKIVDISVNHLWVNVTKKVSLELELGNSEVGLPVWSSGQARFWINLKNQIGSESSVKLGLIFPLDIGNSDAFTFPARKLSGSFGGSLDAYFAGIDFFSAFDLPFAVKFSVMPSQGSNSSIIMNGDLLTVKRLDGTDTTLAKGQTFYRTTFIGQLYIPTIIQLDLNNFVQFSIGVGLLNVQQSMIPGKAYTDNRPGHQPLFTPDQADKIQDLARVSPEVSPHLMVEYVNHKNAKFGLSAGYDHEFMFGGWIELIPDHLRLELGYTAPLVRDAKPWEPAQFFTITPRFYF